MASGRSTGAALLEAEPRLCYKMRVLRLEAYAKGDRHQVLQAAADAITSSGAWLVDSHLFSGVAATLVFETAGRDIGRLLNALREAGLSLPDPIAVDAADAAKESVTGTLRVTFLDGDPTVRRVVPSVPG